MTKFIKLTRKSTNNPEIVAVESIVRITENKNGGCWVYLPYSGVEGEARAAYNEAVEDVLRIMRGLHEGCLMEF